MKNPERNEAIATSGFVAILSAFLVSDTLLAYGLSNGGLVSVFPSPAPLNSYGQGFSLLAFQYG